MAPFVLLGCGGMMLIAWCWELLNGRRRYAELVLSIGITLMGLAYFVPVATTDRPSPTLDALGSMLFLIGAVGLVIQSVIAARRSRGG